MNTVTFQSLRNRVNTLAWRHDLLFPLFGQDVPNERIWTAQKDILTTLKTIARCIPHAHALYTPDYETEALKGVKAIGGSNMLALSCSYTALVVVEKLVYHSVDPDNELSYFQFWCRPTPRSGVHPESFYQDNLASSEPVILRTIVGFQAPGAFDMETFKAQHTTLQEAKHFYKGGSFAIFMPGSPFHELWKEDCGVHNRLSERMFHSRIQELANRELAVPE